MKSKKILIAGAGQLGSRYLQGLSLFPGSLEIWLQDPSLDSIQIAISRWNESLAQGCMHNVNVVGVDCYVPSEFDLAIISTNANIRPTVVSEVDGQYTIRRWILEKVLAQSEDGINSIVRTIGDRPAWVNTPMHLWSLYANLRNALPKGEPIHAEINNFEGLACSSIHFIDYIARCNSSRVIEINTDELDFEWVNAKRPGFMEVNGSLFVKFSDSSTLKLIGNRDAPYHYVAKIECGTETWDVNGEAGLAESNRGRRVSGHSEFQSQLTAGIIESIFSKDFCNLPVLSESADQHRILINALLKHWAAWREEGATHVPIT
jgi:hypothetical protein